MTRKYFIDNIRWICIMMLFPYHTLMIYNAFDESFYIKGKDIVGTSAFMITSYPWFMPLLFVLAGVSSAYALRKRKPAEYVKERIYKLLIPFICGLLLLVPAQTYFAERFHNGYTGGYWQQYILFFTKPTDLTGYTGGFTPAHLWFILYLFVISLIALPIMLIYKNAKRKPAFEKIPSWALPALFIVPLVMVPVLDIGGKSVGEYFAYFMLGYLLLSNDDIIQKLDKRRIPLLISSIILMAVYVILWVLWKKDIFQTHQLIWGVFMRLYGWTAILAVLGLGSHYLNFRNRVTDYLSVSSFPVYLFHQSWLVAVAYYVFSFTDNIPVQMAVIMLLTFPLTYVTYEICRRVPGVRFMFGIKAKKAG